MTKFIGAQDCESLTGPVVVIDVFRAFTVAPLAISCGAREVILVENLAAALTLKAATPSSLAFKDGPPQAGFDLFNSPAQLLDLDVRGKTIYQCTTAGTAAALAAAHCKPLCCASFVCAAAAANYFRQQSMDPTFVISGADGNAAEDLAAAQFIEALISNPQADPARYVEAARHAEAAADLRTGLERGYAGVDTADIDICLDVDRLDFCLLGTPEPRGVALHRFPPLE